MKTGLELIAEEKERLMNAGDILSRPPLYSNGELLSAAAYYCLGDHITPIDISSTAQSGIFISIKRKIFWPWYHKTFHGIHYDHLFSEKDKIAELAKAGAFIATEMDRLQNQ